MRVRPSAVGNLAQLVEHRIENAGVPGSSPGVAIESDPLPHRRGIQSINGIVVTQCVSEFVGIDNDEDRRDAEHTCSEANCTRQLRRRGRKNHGITLEPQRHHSELPRLARGHKRECCGCGVREVGVERRRHCAVLVHPRSFYQRGINAKQFFAQRAERTRALALTREHGVDLVFAQQPLRDKEFAKAGDACGCGGSGHGSALARRHDCSSTGSELDFCEPLEFLRKAPERASTRR